jgi:hypothetical protein
MTVEGDVFLDQGFHATGAVRLLGARIQGQLSCRGARLENPNGDALSADGMTVEGGVFLDQGFHATGAVRLLGARIQGQLSCRGARLENPNGIALSADGMTVEGDVFLDEGFHATGAVRLLRARIRGALVCTEARFENPNGIALNLEHARLGGIEDDEGSWPQRGRLRIDGLEYEGFAGDRTPTDARRRLEWLRRQLPDFRPQPYDQLARVFRRMGREADAVEVLIAKQEDLIRHGKLSWWGRLTRRILGVTIGHGYRSGRALLWSLAFVIAGALIFGWANARGLMAPSSPEILTDPLYRAGGTIPPDYPRFRGPRLQPGRVPADRGSPPGELLASGCRQALRGPRPDLPLDPHRRRLVPLHALRQRRHRPGAAPGVGTTRRVARMGSIPNRPIRPQDM